MGSRTRLKLKYQRSPEQIKEALETEIRARVWARIVGDAYEQDRQEILEKVLHGHVGFETQSEGQAD